MPYPILFCRSKKLFYQLYHTILQYTQHPNFYFPILLIKIIFLHNKIHFIIKIIFSYSTLSLKYIFFGWHNATVQSHIWDRTVALCQKNLACPKYSHPVAGAIWAQMPNEIYNLAFEKPIADALRMAKVYIVTCTIKCHILLHNCKLFFFGKRIANFLFGFQGWQKFIK